MAEYPYTSNNGKSILTHRLIWQEKFGIIKNDKTIHHLDGDKYNYRIDNLVCITKSLHSKIHWKLIKTKRILDLFGKVKLSILCK